MASVQLITEAYSGIGLGSIPPEAKASAISGNFENLGNFEAL